MMQPTHFVAVRIGDEDIASKVDEIQESLIAPACSSMADPYKSWLWTRAMTQKGRLHFTLFVACLNGHDCRYVIDHTEDCVADAKKAFKASSRKLKELGLDGQFDLTVGGLGNFGDKILFSKIMDSAQVERMTLISNVFRDTFKEFGVIIDSRPFQPHMTICNLFKAREVDRKHVNIFKPDVWSKLKNVKFGTQKIMSIQLLNMREIDKQTNYYRVVKEYKLRF